MISFSKINSSKKDVSISDLNLSVPGKTLLIDSPLKLAWQHRYVLIGANGTGKTTILKNIATGAIPTPPCMTTFLVSQELDDLTHETDCVGYVCRSDEKKQTLLRRERELEDLMADSDTVLIDEILDEFDQVSLELRNHSRDEADVYKILHGLGFDNAKAKSVPDQLSGGWKMKLSLARALFVKPDLLLLDEPTNHLDIKAIIRLTEWLSKWPTTLLCVTHNYGLIDDIATDTILLLDDEKILRTFRGTYADTLKTLKSERCYKEKGYHFDFGTCDYDCPESACVKVSDVCFSYDDSPFLRGIDFCINSKSRVALVGANGAGKTSIFKLLMGILAPTKGCVETHRKLRTAYFSQHGVDNMPEQESPISFIGRRHDISLTSIHKALSKFDLQKSDRSRVFSQLSGGQRTRVLLTDIYLQQPHVLILDEITNHLDIESVMRLADAIRLFPGGILMASHDCQLLNILTTTCDSDEHTSEIWELDRGELYKLDCKFADYVTEIRNQS